MLLFKRNIRGLSLYETVPAMMQYQMGTVP